MESKMKMNPLLLIPCVTWMVYGCSSLTKAETPPPTPPKVEVNVTVPRPEPEETPRPYVAKLRDYDGPSAMEEIEVIQMAKQCHNAGLRPNIEYTAVRLNTGGKTLVPIRVHCEPF
jgi:hypothetical protein